MVRDDPLPGGLYIGLAEPMNNFPRFTRTRLRRRG